MRAHYTHPLHAKLRHAIRTKPPLSKEFSSYRVLEDFPVYVISAANAARNGLQDAVRDGRMLLIRWPSGLLAQVDVREKEDKHEVARMSTGTMALELAKTAERMRSSFRTKSHTFQLRILSVPSIHLAALWGHRKAKSNIDRFIPLTENFIGLKRNHPYACRKIDSVIRQESIRLIIKWYERQQPLPPSAR